MHQHSFLPDLKTGLAQKLEYWCQDLSAISGPQPSFLNACKGIDVENCSRSLSFFLNINSVKEHLFFPLGNSTCLAQKVWNVVVWLKLADTLRYFASVPVKDNLQFSAHFTTFY